MDTLDSKPGRITPLTEKLKDLEKKGFDQELRFVDGVLKDEAGNIYKPSDLKIVEEHRFEGESDPGDMTILYAVESDNGLKGTVVTPYGTYEDELAEFMIGVEEKSKLGK